MLATKIIEDPDFPVVPPWHEEFLTLRPWFDVALALPEDCDSDIFVHKILVDKVFKHFNKHMVAPTVPKLCAFRFGAANEAQKMMQAEVDAAALYEPGCLLRIKNEDLIPEVAKTEEEKKALRKVSPSDMNIPRILKYRERSVILLLDAKMRAIMRNSKHVAEMNDICICDIISQYSDDEGEDHFNGASTIENMFPQHKRNTISGWASSIETPAVHHIGLTKAGHTYCAPLEPIGEADDMTEGKGELQELRDITWELQGCSLEFPRGHDGEVLLRYGYQVDQGVSECYFTNMISAASASEKSSNSSVDEDEGNKAANLRKSDTSLESSADYTEDMYNYPGKRLARASIKRFNKRRISNLQKAWDIPHRAHSLDQSGYRSHITKTQPAQDANPDHVPEPRFPIREEVPSPLEEFNKDYEAKHIIQNEINHDARVGLSLPQRPQMGSSDNLRASLTPRHHQDDEMLRILALPANPYGPSPPKFRISSHRINGLGVRVRDGDE